MRIVVCVKDVPAKGAPLNPRLVDGQPQEPAASFEINEADNYALEEGLQLKEALGGELVTICLGPARGETLLRETLAKGADRAIHLVSEGEAPADPYLIAVYLARVLGREPLDILLTGLQSDDWGFGQTGVLLAEILGIPHASLVVGLEAGENSLRVKRELEGGLYQELELPLPVLLTIQSGINKPRYAGIRGALAAKRKKIDKIPLAELDEESAPRPTLELTNMRAPEQRRKTEFLEGDSPSVARQLLERINAAAS